MHCETLLFTTSTVLSCRFLDRNLGDPDPNQFETYPPENKHVPLEGTILKGNFIFQSSSFRGYVSFPGVYLLIFSIMGKW